MIRYINLPKKSNPALTKVPIFKQKNLKTHLQRFKDHPRIFFLSLTVFLVMVCSLVVLVAVNQKNKGFIFRGNPSISSLSTSEGIPSTLVEIKGKHFGTFKPSKISNLPGGVVFTGSDNPTKNPEGVEAMIVSWTDSKISFFVPPEASSGYIYIVNREDEELHFSNGEKFTIKKPEPKVTSLSTSSSHPSDVVSLRGEGLGNFMQVNLASANKPPTFPGHLVMTEGDKNKVEVAVLSWKDNQIDFYTPYLLSSGKIQALLTFNGEEIASNSLDLKVTAPEPKLSLLQKTEGLPTELITIVGENLGRVISNPTGLVRFPGHIFFGKSDALIESWSPNEVTAYVPIGVKEGDLEVKVLLDYLNDGVVSNSQSFKVSHPDPKLDSTVESALPSEVITLRGSGFGNQISSDRIGLVFPGRVYFSPGSSETPVSKSVVAPILGWGDDSIEVNVPVGAQEGKVFVARSLGGEEVFTRGLNFTPKVPEPEIESISTDNAAPGEIVEIFGKNLGVQMGTTKTSISYPGRVSLGDKIAVPAFGGWREDRIAFYVPWGSKSGRLKVTLQSGSSNVTSNEKDFKVTEPKVKIDKVTVLDSEKNRITIRGQGFGSVINNPYVGIYYPGKVFLTNVENAQGNNTKVLGASQIEAKIEAWSDDRVIINLPKKAKSGFLYVTVTSSNGVILSNSTELKNLGN